MTNRLRYEVRLRPGILADRRSNGIVYYATRAGCEDIAARVLDETRLSVAPYHGGLSPAERNRTHGLGGVSVVRPSQPVLGSSRASYGYW